MTLGFLPSSGRAGTIGGYGDYSNEEALYTSSPGVMNPYVVGDRGTNNLLTLSNEFTFTTGYTMVGGDGGHNTLLVTDGARIRAGWYAAGWHVMVGSNSSHNAWIARRGAGAAVRYELTAGLRSGADHNAILVTGEGTVLTNERITVGWEGSHNSMLIGDGGKVLTHSLEDFARGVIGREGDASHNTVTVTGEGSEWVVRDSLVLGYGGEGNRLDIRGGGKVHVEGYVDIHNTEEGTGHVLRVEEGGELHVERHMLVGPERGKGARLEIDGPGTLVSVSSNFWTGWLPGADESEVIVSNQGRLELGPQSDTRFGWHGSGHHARIESGGTITNSSAGPKAIVIGSAGNHTRMTVDGEGSMLGTPGRITVGFLGGHNELIVTNGGRVYGGSLHMDEYHAWRDTTYDGSNTVLVAGEGSRLFTGGVRIGGTPGAEHNRFIIRDGGIYSNTSPEGVFTLGGSLAPGYDTIGGSHNQVLVEGGALHATTMRMGGTNSLLRISDGGSVSLADTGGERAMLRLDGWGHSVSNRIEVTGPGSSLAMEDHLHIALSAGSRGSVVDVSSNATLNVATRIYLGFNADALGGALKVNSGGKVSAGQLYMHFGSGNRIEVDGPGSELNFNQGDQYLGRGTGNVIRVTGGGRSTSTTELFTWASRRTRRGNASKSTVRVPN